MQKLSYYTNKFKSLHTAKVKGEKAPHKPILLLSIIEGIRKKEISENKIFITPELVAEFKYLWHQLVSNPTFTANFSLPFYHLSSKTEGFWHLKTYPGASIILTSSASIKSLAHLKQVVAYGYFDDDLYQLLSQEASREILKYTLISIYFAGSHASYGTNSLISQIARQILEDPPGSYRQHVEEADEEEVFIRSGVFKKEVPKIYNYTCCISGMRIESDNTAQMIDACHIVPFSESHDDTISNGISLCPNLHRAFDRGLIAINNEYRVMVKPIYESTESTYSIKQFDGKQIILPKNIAHLPALENLSHHRTRFDFH